MIVFDTLSSSSFEQKYYSMDALASLEPGVDSGFPEVGDLEDVFCGPGSRATLSTRNLP